MGPVTLRASRSGPHSESRHVGLWVLARSTAALLVFHELGARMGIVTGKGLLSLVRERYGPRGAGIALAALVAANFGTLCAELNADRLDRVLTGVVLGARRRVGLGALRAHRRLAPRAGRTAGTATGAERNW